ncbi:unnamed protein product [Chrysoparadoxa australica]
MRRFLEVLIAFLTMSLFRAGRVSSFSTTPATPSTFTRLSKAADVASFVDRHDNYLLDCDGVLWTGDIPLPGSVETVIALKKAGKRVVFITNNSSKSRRQYKQKFEKFGIPGITEADIVTSGSALAEYVSLQHPGIKTVYSIGEDGFFEELEKVGLELVHDRESDHIITDEGFGKLEGMQHPPVEAVIGLDQGFSYRKLCMASFYIQRGAHFVGTNLDTSDRMGSYLIPGTGPLLQSISNACGVEPVVIGKPNPLLIKQILEVNGFEASRTCMIGDRLDTDIAFGNNGGITSALVMTGVTSEEKLHGTTDTNMIPTVVLDCLGALLAGQDAGMHSKM